MHCCTVLFMEHLRLIHRELVGSMEQYTRTWPRAGLQCVAETEVVGVHTLAPLEDGGEFGNPA